MILDTYKIIFFVVSEKTFEKHYNNSYIDETLVEMGKMASNPELNFTWHDCAILSQKVRNLRGKTKAIGEDSFKELELRFNLFNMPDLDSFEEE